MLSPVLLFVSNIILRAPKVLENKDHVVIYIMLTFRLWLCCRKSHCPIDFKAEHMFCSAGTDAQLKTLSEGQKATLGWEPDPSRADIPCPASDLFVPVVAQG